MLYTKNILEIVKLAIASSYVKNTRPVNILLVGEPEIGKSSILLKFRENNGLRIFTDLTKNKLDNFLVDVARENKQVRYLIVPDFLKVISRNRSARANVITYLNALIEEGLKEVSIMTSRGQETYKLKKTLRVGIATAITRSALTNEIKVWKKLGFMSRFLPISFSYTAEQIKQIRREIFSNSDYDNDKNKIKLNLKCSEVKCSSKFYDYFDSYIVNFAKAYSLYGFRLTAQIKSLLMGSALLRNSKRVTMTDVKKLLNLMKWINLDFNVVE
ncbi:MAG: hypothetical protein QXF15_03320 [Candidatus Aenigmatarchaeota archaeon]